MSSLAICAAASAYLAWPFRRSLADSNMVTASAVVALLNGWWHVGLLVVLAKAIRQIRLWGSRRRQTKFVPLTITQCARVAGIMAACASAGVTTMSMWQILRESSEDAIADLGNEVSLLLRVGHDLESAYQQIGDRHNGLKSTLALATAAHESGASIASALTQLSTDMLERENDAVTARVRSVGVKATLPLGGCFLPAFVLVAIVPMAASLL